MRCVVFWFMFHTHFTNEYYSVKRFVRVFELKLIAERQERGKNIHIFLPKRLLPININMEICLCLNKCLCFETSLEI